MRPAAMMGEAARTGRTEAGSDGPAMQESRAERVRNAVAAAWDLRQEDLPPVEMMRIVGSPDAEHFRNAMVGTFKELAARGGLGPASRVLDLGCGCGRHAAPFVQLVDGDAGGVYWGVDIWREAIDWCRQRLGSQNPAMRFVLRETGAAQGSAAGEASAATDCHLGEIADGTIDMAFAVSVFSHLTEAETRAYLAEMSRVLAPGGIGYLTGFVIDRHFHEYVAATGHHTAVAEEAPGVWYGYRGHAFFAGFEPEIWEAMLEEAGLAILARDVGRWADKPGATRYEDIFVVTRAGEAPDGPAKPEPCRRASGMQPHAYPDFLICGMMKAATTSLYDLLAAHPGVEPAVKKELHYFSRDFVRRQPDELWALEYREMLGWRPGLGRLTGEASPSYILTPERIRAFNPDCRIVISLRDPVERLISHYKHNRKHGHETRPFAEIMADPENPFVLDSLYAPRLARYAELFPPEQILIVTMEHLIAAPDRVAAALFDHLGLPHAEIPMPHLNRSGRDGAEEAMRATAEAILGPRRGETAAVIGATGFRTCPEDPAHFATY